MSDYAQLAPRTFPADTRRLEVAAMLRHGAELAAAQRRVAQALARLTELIGPPVYPEGTQTVCLLLREIDGRWCDISDQLHEMARAIVGGADA